MTPILVQIPVTISSADLKDAFKRLKYSIKKSGKWYVSVGEYTLHNSGTLDKGSIIYELWKGDMFIWRGHYSSAFKKLIFQ